MSERDTDVTIFDGEKLLEVAETDKMGAIFEAVPWLNPIHLTLGVLTAGLWYVVLMARAASSGELSSTEYVITDDRIVESSGVIGSNTTQYNFEELVGDIHTEQGFVQGLLGAGNITFNVQKTRTMGETTGNIGDRDRSQEKKDVTRETITLEGVKNYDEVADTIRRIHRN